MLKKNMLAALFLCSVSDGNCMRTDLREMQDLLERERFLIEQHAEAQQGSGWKAVRDLLIEGKSSLERRIAIAAAQQNQDLLNLLGREVLVFEGRIAEVEHNPAWEAIRDLLGREKKFSEALRTMLQDLEQQDYNLLLKELGDREAVPEDYNLLKELDDREAVPEVIPATSGKFREMSQNMGILACWCDLVPREARAAGMSRIAEGELLQARRAVFSEQSNEFREECPLVVNLRTLAFFLHPSERFHFQNVELVVFQNIDLTHLEYRRVGEMLLDILNVLRNPARRDVTIYFEGGGINEEVLQVFFDESGNSGYRLKEDDRENVTQRLWVFIHEWMENQGIIDTYAIINPEYYGYMEAQPDFRRQVCRSRWHDEEDFRSGKYVSPV
jgi:hypothetical protein